MSSEAKKEAPGGAWASPISSELIVSQSIGLGSPVIAGDGRLYWLEGRPTEGGRQVLVSRYFSAAHGTMRWSSMSSVPQVAGVDRTDAAMHRCILNLVRP